MCFVRRMLRSPWTARRMNEVLMQNAEVKTELMMIIRRRQIGFVMQTLRGNRLEKDCLLGMIQGRRA